MKILYFLLGSLIIISCSSNDQSIVQDIKEWEYSRNPDTSYYSGLLAKHESSIQTEVITSIGIMGQKQYLPLLSNLLDIKNKELIKPIIFSIGQIGGRDAEKLLIEIFHNNKFNPFKPDIIKSLGICGDKQSAQMLLQNLPLQVDSLKVLSIQNLAHINKRNNKINAIPDSLINYLHKHDNSVKNAAVYFFNRNNFKPAFYDLLLTRISKQGISYKYKISALAKILEKSSPDSLMLDSLNKTLFDSQFYKETDWKRLIYKIKILAYFPDSLMTNQIAYYLKNSNPHVRKSAINSLGNIESELSKNILLHHYDKATWNEKGLIILNLAERYPSFIFRLIQQNLDQGTLYFKELLLQSLGKIKDKMSIILLKQFLNVPEPRLQATAFSELDKLNNLTFKNVRPFLLSANEMLTSYAIYWIADHPARVKLSDLLSVYSKFSEIKNKEVMIDIIESINKLKDKNSIAFLDSIYLNTQSQDIAKAASAGLLNFDITSSERKFSQNLLFIPDSILYNSDPILITINTKKGEIEIELWPQVASLTVTNFVSLIKKNFYKNQIFHRVVSDFVIQGGDPTGTGWGGPGYSIPCEYNDKPFVRGSIGIATSGKDTGGSQFFICHSEQPHLNRRYTNFGIVKVGMGVVDSITKDDKILNIVLK